MPIFLLSSFAFAAGEIPQAFTFDGRLYSDSTGVTPMNDPNVTIKIQILDQTETCALYEETQSGISTTTSNGYFTIQVGSAPAASKRTNDSGHTMAQVYSNTGGAIAGKLVSNGAACNYVPVSGDQRFVRMSVTPSLTGVVSTLSPNMPLDSVPNAVVAERAESLQGYVPANFAQLNTTSPADLSQSNLENIFSITNYPALTALLSGTSTLYTKTAGNGTTALPNLATPASPAAGQMWYDAGTIKYYNGSATQTLGVSGAGITSLVVGAGLTPTGTITTSGNIAVDVGTTVGKIVQVQAAGRLPVLDGSNLTSLNGSALTSGTIGGTAAISTSGNLQTSGSITSYRNFLYDNAGAGPGFIGFQAPADIAGSGGASYTMIFPNTRGLAGEVLSTNGSGVLSWISPTTGSVTSITGTAPITITGTAAVPIVNVSPATISSTGVVTLASNGGTTASTVVQATDSRLADSRAPNGSASGDLSGTYPGPTVAKIQGTAVSATAPTTAGQVLRFNGTSWLPNFVAMTDLRSTVTGTNQFASSCLNNQTLTYNSVGDVMSCQNIAVSDSQVTFGSKTQNTFLAAPNGSAGAPTFRVLAAADLPSGVVTTGTYRSVTVDTYGRVTAGTAPTTLAGYSISDAVQNLAGTPGLQTGLDASKPASPAAGTLYFASDTNKIWQYNSGAWATIASASGAGGTITALTGDVSAAGSGSVVGTVNTVGTSTAANIHTAELLANAATELNTASTIVKRDASGNFTAGTVTANLTGNVTGNLTGTVTGAASLNVLKAGDTMTGHLTHAANFGTVYTAGAGANTATIQGPTTAIGTSYVLRLPTAVASVTGQVMTSDTAGNLSWTTPSTTATSYSGVLPVANGGTNSSTTLTNNKIMVSSGGAIVESAALTNGQLLIGSTSAAPVAASITAGSGISVTNGAGSITVTTTGLGNTTLADGRIWVGQTTTPTQVTPGGDIAMTNAGAFTVNAIKGKTVSAVPTGTGQVLRYDGTNWTPNFISMFDLRSTVTGAATFGGGSLGCTSGQTLTWTSLTDNLACTTIAIGDSQITYASQSAKTFLAAPTGSAGAPTYRTLQSTDLPAATVLGINGTSTGSLGLANGAVGGATTSIQPSASTTAAWSLTLPADGGSNTYVLQTNGSGVTSWVPQAGSGTVTSGTANQLAYYLGTGTAVSGNANATVSSGTLTLGQAGSSMGSLTLSGSTAQTVSLKVQATAGGYNFNLPATAGTSGYALVSGGGGASPMTWTQLSSSATSDTTNATNIVSGTLSAARLPAFTGDTTVSAGTSVTTTSKVNGVSYPTSPSTNTVPVVTGANTITYQTVPVPAGGTGLTSITSNQLILGNGTSALTSLAAGSSGQHLQSNGASAPSWTTATFPATATQYDLMYASAANTWTSLAKANTGVLVTSSTGVPSWASGATTNRLLRTNGTTVAFSQADLTTDVTGTLPVANGGTGTTSLAGTFVLNGGQAGAVTLGPSDANSLTLNTAGTAKMTILSGGNVGIGTASPGDALTVVRPSGTNTGVGIVQSSVYQWWSGMLAGSAYWSLIPNGSGGTPAITVTNGGNVGIGTTSPGAQLDLVTTGASSSALRLQSDAQANLIMYNSVASNVGPVFYTSKARGTTASRAIVQSGDNLFSIAPQGYDGSTTVQAALINFAVDGTPGANDMPGRITFATTADGAAAPNERMRIDSMGNVGIGTTNPASNLQIASSVNPSISVNSTTVGKQTQWLDYDNGVIKWLHGINYNNAGDGNWFIARSSGTGNILLAPDGNGNVGVGTTAPAQKFVVSGGASIFQDSTGANGGQTVTSVNTTTSGVNYGFVTSVSGVGASSNTGIYTGASGATTNYGVRITSPSAATTNYAIYSDATAQSYFAGNVGVGTVAPSEKLHVVGNLRVQGSTDCTLGNGAGGTNCSSDIRLKENVLEIDHSLEKILSLRGVEFDWNQKSQSPGHHAIGVIAQDVEKVFPTAVIDDPGSGYKKVDYAVLVAPIIQAFKDLNKRITELFSTAEGHSREIASVNLRADRLEAENKAKDQKIKELEQRDAEMKARLDKIEKMLKSK